MIVTDTDAARFCGCDSTDAALLLLKPGAERAVVKFLRWDPVKPTTAHTRYYPRGRSGGQYTYQTDPTPARGVLRGGDMVALSGGQSQILQLDHKYVLKAGLQVWEHEGAYFGDAAAFAAADLLVIGTDFAFETEDGVWSKAGHLKRIGANWPILEGSVKVSYFAGFTEEELKGTATTADAADIRLATLLAIQKEYNQNVAQRVDANRGAVGVITSESISGYSYSVEGSSAQQLAVSVSLPRESKLLLQPYRMYGRIY